MKKTLILLSTLLLLNLVHSQSVSIIVQTSGFGDHTGTPTNNMAWGVIIDTNNLGFDFVSEGNLQPFSIPTFQTLVELDNGYYFFRANDNTSSSGPPLFSDGFMNIISLLPVSPNSLAGDVATGNPFGLLWFPSSSASIGDSYGFLDPSAVLPPSGTDVDLSGTLSANAATFTVVPEPSTYAAIVGVLALAFVGFRRFRS